MSIVIIVSCLAMCCFFMSGCVHSSIILTCRVVSLALGQWTFYVSGNWLAWEIWSVLFVCLPLGPCLAQSELVYSLFCAFAEAPHVADCIAVLVVPVGLHCLPALKVP